MQKVKRFELNIDKGDNYHNFKNRKLRIIQNLGWNFLFASIHLQTAERFLSHIPMHLKLE